MGNKEKGFNKSSNHCFKIDFAALATKSSKSKATSRQEKVEGVIKTQIITPTSKNK